MRTLIALVMLSIPCATIAAPKEAMSWTCSSGGYFDLSADTGMAKFVTAPFGFLAQVDDCKSFLRKEFKFYNFNMTKCEDHSDDPHYDRIFTIDNFSDLFPVAMTEYLIYPEDEVLIERAEPGFYSMDAVVKKPIGRGFTISIEQSAVGWKFMMSWHSLFTDESAKRLNIFQQSIGRQSTYTASADAYSSVGDCYLSK